LTGTGSSINLKVCVYFCRAKAQFLRLALNSEMFPYYFKTPDGEKAFVFSAGSVKNSQRG